MNKSEFFYRVGRYHEIADVDCSNCVVTMFNKDEGHNVECDNGCAMAIRDVFERLERENSD